MDAGPLLLSLLVWHGATEIASGPGVKGPWQQNASRYDYVDDATVAFDPGGRALVPYVRQGEKDVFLGEVNVSRSPDTFSWLPRLALGPRGEIHVLWQEILFTGGSHGGDILYARSTDGGASFSAPANLSSRSKAGDGKGRVTKESWHNGSLDLAVAEDGTVHAAWTEYEGPLWYTRSTDGGQTFSPRTQINPRARRPARGPSLAVGPKATVYLAWTDGDIHVVKSGDGGKSFGKPSRLTNNRPYSDAPKLAAYSDGTVHLAYAENRRVYYSRNFGEPRPISSRGAGFPHLALDRAGRVHVVWELFPDAQRRPRGLGMALSPDGGHTFSPPAPVPQSLPPDGASNGSQQGLLMEKLAVRPDGEVAIVNSALADGRASRIWLLRASPAN